MSARRFSSCIAIVAVAVLAAGCAGETEPPAMAELAPSPLDEIFDQIWSGAPAGGEGVSKSDQMQILIAECMRDEGFEYVPVLEARAQPPELPEQRPHDRTWVSQNGYGAVVWATAQRGSEPPSDSDFADPLNEEYLASLSASELAAYEEALRGPVIDDTVWTWQTAGCSGWAEHEVGPDDAAGVLQSEELLALHQKVGTLELIIANAGEVEAANQDWAACMAKAGHVFELQEHAAEAAWVDAESSIGIGAAGDVTDAMIAQAREDEITLALADFDCRASTDFATRVNEVRVAHEREFIDDNRELIDAILLMAAGR